MAALDHFRRDPLWYAAQRLLYPVGIEKVASGLHARSASTDQMVDYLLGVPPEKEFDMQTYQTVNPALLGLAQQNVARFAKSAGDGHEKRAFIPGGDPSMAGGDPMAGGGGMPPGGDPMAGGMPPGGGGAPPMDPSMGGGGGMPPGGGGGADPMGMIQPMIQQAVQAALASQGGGAGGAGGAAGGNPALKPKIDQNVVMLQILKILAKIADAVGVQIPASDMVVTPEDLQQMAVGGPGYAAMQSDSPPGGGGGASAIKPISPMPAAAPGMGGGGGEKGAGDKHRQQGMAFDNPFGDLANRATAILTIQGRRSA